MVLPDKATKTIIEELPDLLQTTHWEDHYVFMNYEDTQESMKLCGVMNALTCYAEDILNMSYITIEKQQKIEKIFSVIEFFLNEGDNNVKDASATCFLENLLNDASSGRVKSEMFVHYLGIKSIAYCKAWDEFTAVKTKGLL